LVLEGLVRGIVGVLEAWDLFFFDPEVGFGRFVFFPFPFILRTNFFSIGVSPFEFGVSGSGVSGDCITMVIPKSSATILDLSLLACFLFLLESVMFLELFLRRGEEMRRLEFIVGANIAPHCSITDANPVFLGT
jgi:hypothetical protein